MNPKPHSPGSLHGFFGGNDGCPSPDCKPNCRKTSMKTRLGSNRVRYSQDMCSKLQAGLSTNPHSLHLDGSSSQLRSALGRGFGFCVEFDLPRSEISHCLLLGACGHRVIMLVASLRSTTSMYHLTDEIWKIFPQFSPSDFQRSHSQNWREDKK